MNNLEILAKFESLRAECEKMDNIEIPAYAASKLVAIQEDLDLAIKFLKLN